MLAIKSCPRLVQALVQSSFCNTSCTMVCACTEVSLRFLKYVRDSGDNTSFSKTRSSTACRSAMDSWVLLSVFRPCYIGERPGFNVFKTDFCVDLPCWTTCESVETLERASVLGDYISTLCPFVRPGVEVNLPVVSLNMSRVHKYLP